MNLLLNSPIFPPIPGKAYNRGLGAGNPGMLCDASGNPPGCWVPNGTPGSNIGVLASRGAALGNTSSRSGFVSLMQAIGTAGLDPNVSAGGSGTPATLGGYFAAAVNSAPTAYTSAGCPYQTQTPCALPFSGSQFSQTFDPGTFFDMVMAAQAVAQAGPVQSNQATNYATLAPNATTATAPPPSTAVATSTAGASPASGAPGNPSAVSGCWAWFGDTSCIGPIGTTTALVLAAALVGAYFMFGGKH